MTEREREVLKYDPIHDACNLTLEVLRLVNKRKTIRFLYTMLFSLLWYLLKGKIQDSYSILQELIVEENCKRTCMTLDGKQNVWGSTEIY
jgi:hypothetical protein